MKARLRRMLGTRQRRITALVIVAALIAAVAWVAWPAPAPVPIASRDVQIDAPGGPGVADPVVLDATVYLPTSTPAPAVIMAHGFGGSKKSVAADAEQMARDGFVVLAYSARGFGASTGQIALDSLDYEIPDARAVVDWLAQQPEVQLDGPGDPRVGVTGGSYGGALSLMLAGTDPRVDAAVPLITWNNLEQALFPNAQATPADLAATTPAAASGVGDGVFKKFWASTLMASVTTGAALSATGVAQGDSGDSGFVRRGGTSSSAPAPAPAASDGTGVHRRHRSCAGRCRVLGELRANDAQPLCCLLAGCADRPDHPRAVRPAGPVEPGRGGRATSPPRPCWCRANGTRCSASTSRTRTPGRSRRTAPPWR